MGTIPLVRKGLMGGRLCKYHIHLLIWTMSIGHVFFFKKQQQVFETFIGLLHCLPLSSGVDSNSCNFLLFLRYKKGGGLRYRPNISTHTVQTLSKNWHFLAIYSDCLHCS